MSVKTLSPGREHVSCLLIFTVPFCLALSIVHGRQGDMDPLVIVHPRRCSLSCSIFRLMSQQTVRLFDAHRRGQSWSSNFRTSQINGIYHICRSLNRNVECEFLISLRKCDTSLLISAQSPSLFHHLCETEQVEWGAFCKCDVLNHAGLQWIFVFVHDLARNVARFLCDHYFTDADIHSSKCVFHVHHTFLVW
jgi:hypothetical protein